MNLIVTALAAGLALNAADPAQSEDTVDLHALATSINETMRAHHYNPEELDSDAYRAIETATLELADTADSADAFREGFQALWADGPFSHVVLAPAQAPADALAAHLDTLRIGGGGATLSWEGDIAILDVNTMMGLDTIEEIEAAYAEIDAHGADGLIIDLRDNGGGAFAVKPLVEHVIAEPLDAGVFVSQPWNARMDRAPTLADAQTVEPWHGWSVRAFWADVQVNELTRVRFEPAPEHRYDGPVYVLTNSNTASAAEMAADALKASGRTTLLGETTEGAMLSQTLYDMPGGFHLFLPVADYYSIAHGRIEGTGVTPDEMMDPDAAMQVALNRLSSQ